MSATTRMATYRGEIPAAKTHDYSLPELTLEHLLAVWMHREWWPTTGAADSCSICPGRAQAVLDLVGEPAGWRAFNRLSAAVSKHLARSQPEHPAYRLADENDDELHAAYTRVLRDIAPGGES